MVCIYSKGEFGVGNVVEVNYVHSCSSHGLVLSKLK